MSLTPHVSTPLFRAPASAALATGRPVLEPRRLATSGTPPLAPDGAAAIVALLRRQPLFRLLSDGQLSLLAHRALIRRFAREDRIVGQGERDPNLYVVLRGRVHLEREGDNGRTVLLGMMGAGDRIGDWAAIDGQPHHATARCAGTTEALLLRGEDVLRCQTESVDFSNAWCEALVRQLRERNHRIMCMSLYGVRERVIWRLNEWATEDADGQRVVSHRIGRTELARMVGASREMVCRVLRGLQTAGQIELRRDRSIVLRTGFEAGASLPTRR